MPDSPPPPADTPTQPGDPGSNEPRALPAVAEGATDSRRARIWRAVGATSVAIGLVNAALPLMPTTVFLLIGAWAYGKGSPELRARLLADPRYGAALRLWTEKRQLSRRAKWQSTLAIAASFAISLAFAGWSNVMLAIAVGLVVLVAWLWTRAEPAPA